MKPLDIHRFPLTGQSLIEASAGTGKTWTINQLYRRILLGHGELPAPGGRRLGSADILVVTFTNAATEELRGRIRSGLRDAFENLLSEESSGKIPDKDIARWIKEMRAGSDVDLNDIRDWLQLNLAQMDEAPVSTIHGFSARMLKRFAFDSRTGFNLSVETENQPYLQQACEDIWRQFCYPADQKTLAYVTGQFSGPDSLFSHYRNWVAKPDLKVIPENNGDFADNFSALSGHFETAARLWAEMGSDAVNDLIFSAAINKSSYKSNTVPNWLNEVEQYFLAGDVAQIPKNLFRFAAAELVEKTKSGEPPEHRLFDEIQALLDIAKRCRYSLELHLFRQIYSSLLSLLEQASVMTSDDQLRLLDEALASEQGDHLAAQIRSLYPIAMIDEFQDTDPVQYRIFSRIYPLDNDAENNGAERYALIMIGDPKQAIYAFRGADIFTYMKARTSIAADRTFTLDTNYRSHSELVGAVNTLWGNREKPFIFDDSIEFYPVKSGRLHEKTAPLWEPGVSTDTLQIWYDPQEENKTAASLRVAAECAEQISALLGGAAQFPATVAAGKGRRPIPVQAGDIAVLVPTRNEAGLIRDALNQVGIGSVFLTRDSVYQSAEAFDLLLILEAVAHPSNEAWVRRALATVSWGCTADDLVAMQQDESRWENQLATIHEYQQLWTRRGIVALLMQWLEDDERAVRLRLQPDGERSLTNLIHLGELLQARSRKVRGHAALLRWFHEKVTDTDATGEEAQLRLETDERLVTISTIHKSKGLEYPLVFLPFLWAEKTDKNSDNTYFNGVEVVRNLDPDKKAEEMQQRDALAERLRLLYVALTRARYQCFVWLSDATVGNNKKPNWLKTALGYLLNNEDPMALDLPGVYIGPKPHWRSGFQNELDVPPPPVQAAVSTWQWRDHWRVGSYSGLAAQSSHQKAHVSAEQSGGDLSQALDLDAAAAPALSSQSMSGEAVADSLPLQFPKGVNPGTCLHSIFEHWDFHDDQALVTICEQQLALYGLAEQPVAEVADWIKAIVGQSFLLYDTQASLADIAPAKRLDEMEFYLPVGHLTPGAVETLLSGDGSGHSRFQFEPLSGYLKGFIDLIFEWQGRYYVADYKSNYLGDQASDYLPQALRQSMKEHSYDLQSWIYLVALDQLLSQRLPDYQPQKHLGGSVYLYLRGMGDHFASQDADLGVCFTPASHELLRQWRQALLSPLNVKEGA